MSNDYLIWSYEHDGWWGVGRFGYTPDLAKAGHYTKREAEWIVADANRITVNERMVPVDEAPLFCPAPSIACPRCRRRSFNPHDIAERYCGHCHVFLEQSR